MKRLILLYMSMLINAIFCMKDAVQYKALVNIQGKRVLAQNVAPKDYKKTLKTYNLTPQAMAACVRHFCGLSTTEEKEMQFFQNKKDVNYKDYIATGVLMLQVLKDESDGKGLPYLDWA